MIAPCRIREDVHESAIAEYFERVEALLVDGLVSSPIDIPDQRLPIRRRPELLIGASRDRARPVNGRSGNVVTTGIGVFAPRRNRLVSLSPPC